MRKATLLLFIPLSFLFSGCSLFDKCEPKVVIKEKLIYPKKKTLVNIPAIKDCDMNKGVDFGELNTTKFWVLKTKMAECSNISMERKDKNIFYEKQNRR